MTGIPSVCICYDLKSYLVHRRILISYPFLLILQS